MGVEMLGRYNLEDIAEMVAKAVEGDLVQEVYEDKDGNLYLRQIRTDIAEQGVNHAIMLYDKTHNAMTPACGVSHLSKEEFKAWLASWALYDGCASLTFPRKEKLKKKEGGDGAPS